MLRWHDILDWPLAELARLDVAAINLACAHGLPGSDRLDWEHCFRTLDGWTDGCRRFTARMMPHFHAGRGDFPGSEPKFRVQVMITHLQRDLGVKYHPDRMAEDAVFRPEDSFLHGIIQGDGGTCGNLPVLYASVGRRLGYPITLATTKNHLYCRWDPGPGHEKFNIEATSKGAVYPTDKYLRSGRYAMTQGEVRAGGHQRSLTPREELAGFLGQRAHYWMQERNYQQAAVAFAWANEVDPARLHYALLAEQALAVWKEGVNRQLPDSRQFPALDLRPPVVAQFPHLPNGLELEFIGLTAAKKLLAEPQLDASWWTPLRLNPGQRPPGLPARIPVEFRWTGADSGVTIFPTLPWV